MPGINLTRRATVPKQQLHRPSTTPATATNVAEPTQFSAAKQRFTADFLMTSHMVSTEPPSKFLQTSVSLSQIAQMAHAPYLSPPTESNTALDLHMPHEHHQHPAPGIPRPLPAEIPLTSLAQAYFFSSVSVGSSAGNAKKGK